jgi:hypothetical protein
MGNAIRNPSLWQSPRQTNMPVPPCQPPADRPGKPPGEFNRKIEIALRYLFIPGNRAEKSVI